MNKLKFILIVFALLAANAAKAQAPPPLPFGDSAWVLQTALSDEFDSSALDQSKWFPHWWGGGDIFNGADKCFPINVIPADTTLKFKADVLVPNYYESDPNKIVTGYNFPGQGMTFAYQGSVIMSHTAPYKFGYFEFYIKMPSKHSPSWPGPWVFGSSPYNYYNELDIAENNGKQTFDGNVVGNNYHNAIVVAGDTTWWNGGHEAVVLPPGDSLSGGFHKYSIEWNPERATWYFDDVPTFELFDITHASIPQNYTGVIMNHNVDPAYAALPSDWDIGPYGLPLNDVKTPVSWPQYMEVDYVRYYKLETTDCIAVNTSVCAVTDYDRKVKKNISTNTGCSPDYSPTSKAASYHLRATESILLDEGVKIEPNGMGAYFTAEVMPCPN